MLRSFGQAGKYVTATVAATFVSEDSYHECEKLQLLSFHWLSIKECDKGRGRIAPCFHSLGNKREVSDQLHARDPFCWY